MRDTTKSLAEAISSCMARDRHRLRRRLRVLDQQQHAGTVKEEAWAALAGDVRAAQEHCARRRAVLPVPEFPEELPVSQKREELARAIAAHQVVVICGETGSGKTTQLPKICLSLGRGVTGMIGHTQPRRLAARSVAARIAEELKSPLGQHVGYKVRFSDHAGADTYIKLMTDGILLAEIQSDRFLDHYDTLIIDEAHERSLNIDFLLGYLKQLLPRRPDLKLIITSATIDPQRFSRHFDDAPVIEVSGRAYPVEMRYRPLLAEDEEARDRDLTQAVVEAVDELARLGPGDILVFLSGEREIRETAESLRKHHPPHTEILPLYARLSAREQNKVFQSHTGRRIVLATNVAETSLTVPGIRYVVDTGRARMSRYSHRSKVQRLPIEAISQASANQRAGRCGRVAPGVCVRLYSEEDFLARPLYTPPEISRANLAAVILQMRAQRLGEVEDFPFIDPPDGRYIRDAYQTLHELGAVDESRELTETGRDLARLPVDPRLARMILAARNEGALNEVLVIAAALSVQDPRERPLEAQQAADQRHKSFQDERSDFLSYLKLWQMYHEQARHLSQKKMRAWCQDNFLSYARLRDWHDIHSQLVTLAHDLGLRASEQPAPPDAVHRALLAGLLGNIACKTETQEYLGARGIKVAVFPGSALFKKPPQWFMAAELVETARLYARTLAPISPEWVEGIAAHLVKRSYFEPHWEKKQAAVMAFERVVLYGLVLVARRKVHYGRIDPKAAREIFIRNALVEGEYETRATFFSHNRALIEQVEELEHKSRRRDILVDTEVLYAFYDERVPQEVCDGRSFETWRKEIERTTPQHLFITKDYLMRRGAAELTQEQFPDHVMLDGMRLPLQYRFEPGHAEDGVSVLAPLALLNKIRPEPLEWLVPGLLHEKLVALIKALPKSLRRNFVPAPDFAAACLRAMTPGAGALRGEFAKQLHRMTGVTVPPDAWRIEDLPMHLRMNVKVVDANGAVVAMGRDVTALQRAQGARAAEAFAAGQGGGFERESVTAWDFGDLPEHIEFERHGMTLTGYPALADETGKAALRVFDSEEKASAALRAGLRRLCMLQLRDKIKYVEKNLPGIQVMCLHYASVGSCEELKQDILTAAVERAFFGEGPLPRTAVEFERRKERAAAQLVSVSNDICATVAEILALHHAITKRLKGAVPPAWLKSVADIQEQLRGLVYSGFIMATPGAQLKHLPRYLKAVELRLEKLARQPGRDAPLMAQFTPLWQAWRKRVEKQEDSGGRGPALEEARWLLEELRVSLYAQELKTAVPVSVPRARKLLGIS